MRLAIEGRIENVGAADIFLFMSQTQRTSLVAFERPEQETRVFFHEGQPVWSLSTKVQLQIESRFSAGGGLKLREIEAAVTKRNAAADRVPQSLIAEGLVGEDAVQRELRALSLETLREVATWASGTFSVFDGVAPPPFALTASTDFQALLLDALRGQCQKEILQKEFSSRKGILRRRSGSRNSEGINDSERAMLALASGERTIEEAVRKSGLDEQQGLGAIHVLNALHLLDVLPSQRTSKPEKAAPAPPPAPPPPPTPPAPPSGSTNPFNADRIGKAAAAAPSEDTPQVGSPKASGESTAKLQALPDPGSAKPPQRSLKITTEDKTDQVPLKAPTFAIGRHPRNDLVLKDPRISSFHCRVELEGDKLVLIDLKSRNGTLLNSARIDRAVLKANDQIQLGSTKITYVESV